MSTAATTKRTPTTASKARRAKTTPAGPRAEVLMISDAAPWPLDQGRRIRGCNMLLALRRMGVDVQFASVEPTPSNAPAAVTRLTVPWAAAEPRHMDALATGWTGLWGRARRRIAEYAGADPGQLAGTIALVEHLRPRVVIALGQTGPLMLHAARLTSADAPPTCVWYGADELVNFHLSCLRREPLRAWPTRLRHTLDHALWEQLFVRGLDGAIGVSPRDATLMKHLAGARRSVCIRNGVDLEFFTPGPDDRPQPAPHSLAFWGRMDFEPNVDAMTWFVATVWPRLRVHWPDAVLTIAGKHPTDAVLALGQQAGVNVVGAVDDIRHVAWDAEVAILPMRCGGGIKNKLLEAAAMGKAIVATHHAVRGLDLPPHQALSLCDHPQQWVDTLRRLWSDAPHRRRLGTAARKWVERRHSWDAAARQLVDWLNTFTPTRLVTAAPAATSATVPASRSTPSRKAA